MTIEAVLRFASFGLILVLMGVAETVWPRRPLTTSKPRRWFVNLSASVLSTILVRILLPVIPTGVAVYCAENGIGLFHFLHIPTIPDFILGVLLLDMLIYWQHVAFHKQQLLWRIHRMHHADTNIDTSTGVRFHPIEIIASMCLKLLAVVTLGPPASAVLAFEIILNGCALFNHANFHLPAKIDRPLRRVLVTPDMHRVHHSTNPREFNTNFGFSFSWWDRLFRSYKAQPDKGHDEMNIGLNIFRDKEYLSLFKMLQIPFI